MMYHRVVPVLDTDTEKVIKVPEITCTEHQFQISTEAVSGTIQVQGRSVGAADYGLLGTIDLSAASPPHIKMLEGVYESIKLVPSTGIAFTAVYTCWSWF